MKFLLSAYTGLGNFLLKTPLIEAIKNEFPECQLDIIAGTPWSEGVIRGYQGINKLFWLPLQSSIFDKIFMLRKLRKVAYDAIFLPFDATPVYLSLGIPLIIRPKKTLTHFVLQRTSWKANLVTKLKMQLPNQIFVPVLKGRHETDLNFDLLEYYLKKPIDRVYQTQLSYESTDYVERNNLSKEYLVVQLSARHGLPTPKTWAPNNFTELINRWLTKYPNYKVVLVGNEADRDSLADDSILKMPHIIDLMGKTTINDLCNVIVKAKVVIAHDSGLMHITNALEIPMIALYGPTDITRTRPLANTSQILESNNECFLKMYGFSDSEPQLAEKYPDYYCMSGISVDDVFASLEKLVFPGNV